MGALSEIVDALESKLETLAKKMAALEQANRELSNRAAQQQAAMNRQAEEVAALKQQNESLKMANSLLGSDDNKRETKLRINSLIREIDYCIAQLSE
jgi:chromosome segregation ATPase